jgi:hypothetical protein
MSKAQRFYALWFEPPRAPPELPRPEPLRPDFTELSLPDWDPLPRECSPPFLPASLARCGSLAKLPAPPRCEGLPDSPLCCLLAIEDAPVV